VFQILKNPQFDFMSRRNLLLMVSAVVVLASVVVLWFNGLRLGIEFTGGTEIQVKFAETPDIAAVRSTLSSAGMAGQSVTTIGDPAANEVYIRLATGALGGEEDDPTSEVIDALRSGIGGFAEGRDDLNILDQGTLERNLRESVDLASGELTALAANILERRRETAIFRSFDDLATIEGMTPEVLRALQDATYIGPLAIRSQSYIGPAVGRELMNKAMFAIVGSLIGMLVYIWIRFQLQWGLAAVVALAHDTLLTLGLFSLFGMEMSLPVVAAFLTLIGYSVNDTVVVFDRIRENTRLRRSQNLERVVNDSINQTLSRTVITSGLTWIVVFSLFVFGGAALKSFAFVLSVGVFVGTYSSIYVASPFLLLWRQFVGGRKGRERGGESAPSGKAKKIRASSTGS
jgi:preprotein translocase subunit SecF